MAPRNLLRQFGLTRNPFTDRTAEKTRLDANAVYMRSDLISFSPNDTTYLFFGRRGSGKTTIRLIMQTAYDDYNATPKDDSRGHYIVDLCSPSHMTACLTDFKEIIGAEEENWDALFRDHWSKTDVVDCILSYVATDLMRQITDQKTSGENLIEKLKKNPRQTIEFLILVHLYARCDTSSLAYVRTHLMPRRIFTRGGLKTTAMAVTAATAGVVGTKVLVDMYGDQMYEAACASLPAFDSHGKWYGLMSVATALVAAKIISDRHREWGLRRAHELQSSIRIIKPKSASIISRLLSQCFQSSDTIDVIQTTYIGKSSHQKLERLRSLVQLLGYESLAIFGDCFDEVRYPEALKIFARETCRNDLLNFGRMHLFFPESRLGLDLNTDKTLKEARFDRHFVRDLKWSRHQLADLAERRFRAAQESDPNKAEFIEGDDPASFDDRMPFSDLFRKVLSDWKCSKTKVEWQVRGEAFTSYISKLSTPRELMIVMSEMFDRMEAHPEEGLTAQDMEIAVNTALEQSL